MRAHNSATYDAGCHCEDCRWAKAEAQRRHRAREHAARRAELIASGLLRIARERPDWYDHAACKGQTDVMYDLNHTAAALEVCAGCTVRPECREQARLEREHGVWGGETQDDRARAGSYPPISGGRLRELARQGASS